MAVYEVALIRDTAALLGNWWLGHDEHEEGGTDMMFLHGTQTEIQNSWESAFW